MIMIPQVLHALLMTTCLSIGVGVFALDEPSISRKEKHFSLFSVVTFKNEQCTSETTLTGGARAGTCYSTTECSDKSGMASGNCAAGFGVCCVFLNNAGVTATITENRTHIRNKEYPSYTTVTASTSTVYTIKKMAEDICQIRLDFNTFTIAGPSLSTQLYVGGTQNHNCLNDQLLLATTGNTNRYPTICGTLKGEHLYVDLSPTSADTLTITIAEFLLTTAPSAAIAQRTWDFQTSQIPCYATYRAPAGCMRYLTTDSGKITSLNFYKISGSSTGANLQNSALQLGSQNVNTCIRRSKGMCCVEYQVCIVDTQSIALADTIGTTSDSLGTEGRYNEGWTIDTAHILAVNDEYSDIGAFDAMCSDDYLEIPSSWTGQCGHRGVGAINTRYCGSKFGGNLPYTIAIGQASSSQGVCDCSEPFVVRHGTDFSSDRGGPAFSSSDAAAQLLVPNRGFCLDFLQQPCSA
jgi:hypothetical protein